MVLGGFLAAAVVPSDSRALATAGSIILWFDDITNTANGTANVCMALDTNDKNADANGNNGKSTKTKDKNGTGNGNAGLGSGGGSICF